MKIGKHILTWTLGDIVIAKNKSFEYQFELGNKSSQFDPFEFSVRLTSKHDHPGPSFVFGISGLFWISLRIYDHRHWDCEKDHWE